MSAAEVAALKVEKSTLETETNRLVQKLHEAKQEASLSDKAEEIVAMTALKAELESILKDERDKVGNANSRLARLEGELNELKQRQEEMLQQRSRDTYNDCQAQFKTDKSALMASRT
ncbi:hypothetical protein OIV83_000170 [Microbotryomycetes sp. JL201]|nr:hypothetical protein OIV83_000170 [Microbotryomycetes sp. JL201]